MDNKEKLNIYVDIDSLFDTRLALLYYLDQELAASVSSSGTYYSRVSDKFNYITTGMFKSLYRARNKSLLNLAAPTNILSLVREYSLELSTNASFIDNTDRIKIYVNTHRYDFNIEEQTILEESMQSYIGNADIMIVDIPDIEVTPTWIQDNISVMFMYDGMEWLELHTSTLELISKPLPDVIMLVPALLNNDRMKKQKDIEQFFDQLEEETKLLIDIKLLPANDFSRI